MGGAIGSGLGLASAPRGVAWLQPFHEHYELGEKLGSGSFASVHLARHPGIVEDRAVKVLNLHYDGQFPGQVEVRRCQRAWREVEFMQRLRYEAHIVQLADVFFEGGFAYLLMERAESSLYDAMSHLPDISEVTLRRFFREMAQGIAAVHRMDIVHRDVKPDNFLCFGPGAVVKLCDFGLSSALPQEASDKGGLLGVYGTPPYMAPEMLGGFRYGAAVDVWSLGALIYVVLLGEYPYMPADRSGAEMKVAIVSDSPAPTFQHAENLRSAGLRISRVARSFLHEMLCRRPQGRPTASEALESAFLSGEAGAALPPCLRLALRSARQIGAFGSPNTPKAPSPAEEHLARLQVAAEVCRRPSTGGVHNRRPQKDMPRKTSAGHSSHTGRGGGDFDHDGSVGSTTCASGRSVVDVMAILGH